MSFTETVAGVPPTAPFVAILSTPLFGGAWILSVSGTCYSLPMQTVSLETARLAGSIIAKAIGAELKPGNDMAAEADYRHAYICESARDAVEAMADGDMSHEDMVATCRAVLRPR